MTTLRRIAFAVFLVAVGSGPWGCADSTDLKRIRTPSEGVTLRYAWAPGQRFDGTLLVGNTRAIEGLDKPLTQTATCEVTMVVDRVTATEVDIRATFNGIDLEWNLPPTATYSTDELLQLADRRVKGMQVRLRVHPNGQVMTLPSVEEDVPVELQDLIDTLVQGLDAFFIPLPPSPLMRHQPMVTSHIDTNDTGLRRELSQTLEVERSYIRAPESTRLEKLAIEQLHREQHRRSSSTVTTERKARGVMLFSQHGYPVQIDRQTQQFDPQYGMVFRKVRSQWAPSQGDASPASPTSGGTMEIQVIRDPCDRDYVGSAPCREPPSSVPPRPAPAVAPSLSEPSATDPSSADPPPSAPPPTQAAPLR